MTADATPMIVTTHGSSSCQECMKTEARLRTFMEDNPDLKRASIGVESRALGGSGRVSGHAAAGVVVARRRATQEQQA